MRVFDIYENGLFKRSIIARSQKAALQELKRLYPYMNEKYFEIKERKLWFSN